MRTHALLASLALALLASPLAAPRTDCTAQCDCPQGSFCFYGACITDPRQPVYCADKPGCPPGAWGFGLTGGTKACTEDPEYVCQDACDCGPGHACLAVPGLSHKTCVRDSSHPSDPGPSIFGVTVPSSEPTYCCAPSSCEAGLLAYSAGPGTFRCLDRSAGVVRDYCTGTPCYSVSDCEPGESCIDTRPGSPAKPNTSCSVSGGYCRSHAAAEAVYGWPVIDLLPACSTGFPAGFTCIAGWRPGGAYAIHTVVRLGGACGNGTCDAWESAMTCAADCSCGDGVCDSTEATGGTCPGDCGVCGDGICTSPETPKTCPSDCTWAVGDGSCSPEEVAANLLTDCGCPDSASYADYPAVCGDGVCQKGGHAPEDCRNCPRDCPATVDGDGDGVPDGCDACPDTPAGSVVNVDGCSIPQQCPCAGIARSWKNHGEYQRCVSHAAELLLALGRITATEKDGIVASAARSSCGKRER